MKQILCTIFSFFLWSAIYAEEIPYELLTSQIVDKLQRLGMKSINFYSYKLYNSDDTESLIKTRKKIESFKTNKENCANFIYFWWYNWAPMSERGYIENAYMTPAEAYAVCKIGEAMHDNIKLKEAEEKKKEENLKEEKERNEYTKWLKEGVPSSVYPNQDAILRVIVDDIFIQYITSIRKGKELNLSIPIKVDTDGNVTCLSSDENDINIVKLLNIKVVNPAAFVFKYIGKSILMESIETISIQEERHGVKTRLYTRQYEASVKYNKSASKWDVKLTKYYSDTFNEDTAPYSQIYLEAVSNALSSLGTKPKKFIKFHLFDSSLNISSGKKQKYLLERVNLPPFAIIDKTQSWFAKINNWN